MDLQFIEILNLKIMTIMYKKETSHQQPFAAMGADVVKSSAVRLSIPIAIGMLG